MHFLSLFFIVLFFSLSNSFALATQADNMKETFISVEGAEIFCRTIGEGDPIIVLHGGPGLMHDYLYPTLSKLAETNLLVFYDQRGSGRSTSEINQETMNTKVFVKDIESMRKAFKLQTITLLGHSWGSFLAIIYATTYPDSTNKLILLNPMPVSFDENLLVYMERSRRLRPYQEELKAIEQSYGFITEQPDSLQQFLNLRARINFHNPDNVKLLNLKFSLENFKTWPKIGNEFAKSEFSKTFNLYKELENLKTQTLIIHALSDFIPLSSSQNIHNSIPNSQLLLFENCGHCSIIEKPQEILQSINNFLQQDFSTL